MRNGSEKNKKRTEIEERIGKNTEDIDLIDLHELESTLVYFATSLRANGVVLDRLTRYKRLEQYPEDKELLGDVIVENRQAIEMTSIYRDVICDRQPIEQRYEISDIHHDRYGDSDRYIRYLRNERQ